MNKSAKQGRPNAVASGVDEGNEVEAVDALLTDPRISDGTRRRVLEAAGRHKVEWQWVKGHAGHPENERADRLASDAAVEAGKRG